MDRSDRHRRQVRRFYDEIWNRADLTAIPDLLAADVTFRGSLGPVLTGPAEFADYVREVTAALGDYRCEIVTLVAEGDRVAARMTFSGVHRGPLLGMPATGRRVSWAGGRLLHVLRRPDRRPVGPRRPRLAPPAARRGSRMSRSEATQPGGRATMRKPDSLRGGSSVTSTRATEACGGPDSHQAHSASTPSGAPSKTASTAPSARLHTQPVTPCRVACCRQVSRKNTPCTWPHTRTRRRITTTG